MIDVATVANALTAVFERVHRERMAGLPILHPGLSVAVIGARQWRQDWLGMLLTPWCMNLVIVPGSESVFASGPIGTKQLIEFPAGAFEFIASDEAEIGAFAACSMFSPMQTFVDQAGAVATAEAVMVALFEPEPELRLESAAAVPGGEVSPEPVSRNLSRRDLLRGRLTRRH